MSIVHPDGTLRRVHAFIVSALLLSLSASAQSPGAPPPGAQPGSPPPPTEGVIRSVSGSTLVLALDSGQSLTVELQADALVLGRHVDTLDSIKPGEALGVAATKGDDGSLTATAINIFSPELWQRVRRGQFPMPSGQVMTNAELDKVVDHKEGRTIYLKFDMLTAAIVVPPGTDIHRTVSLKISDLAVGMRVSVRGRRTDSGTLEAANLSVDLPPG